MIVASLFFFFHCPRFSLIVFYGLFLDMSSEVIISGGKMKFCSRKCRHTRQGLLSHSRSNFDSMISRDSLVVGKESLLSSSISTLLFEKTV
jgi:hypothetical protein